MSKFAKEYETTSVMQKISVCFLRGVIVLIACIALFVLIRFPLTEGRAADLDLFHIYADPFILYGYASSIAFFAALYKAFKILGYIGQDDLFSTRSIKALRGIKYCAIILSILIVAAGIYIRFFHGKGDDPAGFLALCIIATFISIALAIAVALLEKILQRAVDMQSENDLTI